ncbi:long-chain-fatty-acid--CoA ligase FadD12 domain protein [Mycobacterium kansasii]|uniref:Long-chain-fatty-acid--CoA ligase FadD12 domain protein n=1 Tax=Mycobacterium kansasii TaxID=1768 RepID=A0A1V3WF43_MYCKA|nr:long-chain-fatty-acid--CoA ligase FadD12 domain protein [Mycobacterium kansasii]
MGVRLIAPMRPDVTSDCAAMRREGMDSPRVSPVRRSAARTARADRRTRHAHLAAARRAQQRPGRRAAGLAGRSPESRRHHVPQPSRVRRGSDSDQPDRAHTLLLNTSFAGPALADVVSRENVDTVIYDEDSPRRWIAPSRTAEATRIVAWTDNSTS